MLLPAGTEVRRSAGGADARRAEDIALAFLGAGPMPDVSIAGAASWDRTGRACTIGGPAIEAARLALAVPAQVRIEEVAQQGKAAAVSGRYSPDGQDWRLFCQVIRFTSPEAREIAQLVSFEHREAHRG